MKIVAPLFWALWATATSVKAKKVGGLLRSKAASGQESDPATAATEGLAGMTLYIDNVAATALSADHIVNDALVAAYNKVHDNGYRLLDTYKVQDVLVPEAATDHDKGFYWVGRRHFKYGCESCADARGVVVPPLLVAAKANPMVHQQFVDEFCTQLRTSGVEALAGIQSCGIDFVPTLDETSAPAGSFNDNSNSAVAWPWNRKKQDNGDQSATGSIGVQVELVHVAGAEDTFDSDMSVVPKAVIAAYNEGHADTGFTLTTMNLQRLIRAPENDDGEDDPTSVLGAAAAAQAAAPLSKSKPRGYYTVGIYSGGFGCTMCRDDRSLPPPVLLAQLMDDRHKAFENLVRSKLVGTGLAEYQELRDVRIHFSYTEDAIVVAQQQRRQ